MDSLLVRIVEILRQGKSLARAVIVSCEGSAPRTAGSCMLADERGILAGSVGGGALEGQALAVARQVLCEKSCTVLNLDLQGECGADMICGGRLRLLVEPLTTELLHFEALMHALQRHKDVWSARNLCTGERQIFVTEDFLGEAAPLFPSFLQVALASACAARHDTVLACAENSEWLLERWRSSPLLILAGGGHVAQATAQIAEIAGFSVMVIDDREEFVSLQRFPAAISRTVCPEYRDCLAHIPPNNDTFLIILTRGHAFDASVLEQGLILHRRAPLHYLGMIGSSRKRDFVYDDLQQKGFSPAELALVHCPVGLPLRAETPGEIAVSIVAECVQSLRMGKV